MIALGKIRYDNDAFRAWAERYAREHSNNVLEHDLILNFLIFVYQKALIAKMIAV